MKILDGKKLAKKILEKIRKEVKRNRLRLKLAVVQVGENPVSEIFINQKRRASESVGIDFKLFRFPAKIDSQRLKEEIKKIVRDKRNSGVVIQLPLPKNLSCPDEFLNLIPAKKDVDLLSEKSLGRFYQGSSPILPPVVSGILKLFKHYNIELKGKNIVLIGAGKLVGLPLALQLLREKATVSILNEFTRERSSFTKRADILISGVGRPNLINGKMVKSGIIVIDAGTSQKSGKLVGDVDFNSVSKKASLITPVPGGVGPLTVASLLENLIKLKKKKF